MKRLAGVLVVIGLIGLTGCAGDAQTRATAALAIACDGLGTTLKQVAPKIPTMEQQRVDQIVAIRDSVSFACSPNSTVDPAKWVGTVQAAIDSIKAIAGGTP